MEVEETKEPSEQMETKVEMTEEEKRDLLCINEYLEESNKRQQWKEQLRQKNSDLTHRLDENDLRKLDSSLKKVSCGLYFGMGLK